MQCQQSSVEQGRAGQSKANLRSADANHEQSRSKVRTVTEHKQSSTAEYCIPETSDSLLATIYAVQ